MGALTSCLAVLEPKRAGHLTALVLDFKKRPSPIHAKKGAGRSGVNLVSEQIHGLDELPCFGKSFILYGDSRTLSSRFRKKVLKF